MAALFSVLVVWLRSGVQCQGAVKFSRGTDGLWDKGEWAEPSPCLPACRAPQEGASFLKEGLGTWADPCVLGSHSQ